MRNDLCCLCQTRTATDFVDERFPVCIPCLSPFTACEPAPLPWEHGFVPWDQAPANDTLLDVGVAEVAQ